jgi:hypothetical protein
VCCLELLQAGIAADYMVLWLLAKWLFAKIKKNVKKTKKKKKWPLAENKKK